MRFWNFDWDEGNIDHIARHGVVPDLKRLIPLPMDERIYKEVQRQARRLGMSPLTLIQKLVEISLQGGKSPTRRVR
jgi:hypothetical protein